MLHVTGRYKIWRNQYLEITQFKILIIEVSESLNKKNLKLIFVMLHYFRDFLSLASFAMIATSINHEQVVITKNSPALLTRHM